MTANDFYDSDLRVRKFDTMFRSIWDFRFLILLIVKRDLLIRYRRSFLGVMWSFINPLLSALVLWGVFVTVFRVKLVDGAQFAPYVLSGVLLVTLFVQGVQQCADSLQVNSSVFMKIRVPPHIFALASTFTNGVNFLFGLQALVVVSILSGAGISLRVVLIGFLLITMIVMIVGIGLFLTVCYIRFDDIRNIVAVLLSMLTFLTPVFYPIDILNPIARFIVNLNPLTSGLDIFRFLLSDTGKVTTFDFCYLSSFAILVFYCGFQFFAKQLPRTVSML